MKYYIPDYRGTSVSKMSLMVPMGYPTHDTQADPLSNWAVLSGGKGNMLLTGNCGSGVQSTCDQMLLSVLRLYSPDELNIGLINCGEYFNNTPFDELPNVDTLNVNSDQTYKFFCHKINDEIQHRYEFLQDHESHLQEGGFVKLLYVVNYFDRMLEFIKTDQDRNALLHNLKTGPEVGIYTIFVSDHKVDYSKISDITDHFKHRLVCRSDKYTSIELLGSDAASLIEEPAGQAVYSGNCGVDPYDVIHMIIPYADENTKKEVILRLLLKYRR